MVERGSSADSRKKNRSGFKIQESLLLLTKWHSLPSDCSFNNLNCFVQHLLALALCGVLRVKNPRRKKAAVCFGDGGGRPC